MCTNSLYITLSMITMIKWDNCRPSSSNFVEMPFWHVTKINPSRRNSKEFIISHLEESKLEVVQCKTKSTKFSPHHTVFTSTVFCHFASERARGSMPRLLVRNRRRLLIFVLLIERHCLLMPSLLLDNDDKTAESFLKYCQLHTCRRAPRTVDEHYTHILFLMRIIRGLEP